MKWVTGENILTLGVITCAAYVVAHGPACVCVGGGGGLYLCTRCIFDIMSIVCSELLVFPPPGTRNLYIVWPADVLHVPIYTITAMMGSAVNLSAAFTPSEENLDNVILSSFFLPFFLSRFSTPLWSVNCDKRWWSQIKHTYLHNWHGFMKQC